MDDVFRQFENFFGSLTECVQHLMINPYITVINISTPVIEIVSFVFLDLNAF